ncbi:MAG: FAD-dependent oxidoreductase, partial [Alphaproteobacteria bacterium]
SVLSVLAHGMSHLADEVRRLAEVNGAVVSERAATGNYPLPGHDSFGFVYIDEIPGFDGATAYRHVRGSPAGAMLFKVVADNLAARGISPRLETAADRLFTDARGNVVGVLAGGRAIEARRGVVLACGGFEGSADLQIQYWQAKPVFSAAFRGNTGDGIRMAQDLGAALWHMWHFHGTYGFRHVDGDYPFAIRTKRLPDWLPGDGPENGPRDDVQMPWILLDRQGRRFMNEYEPYLQDTGARGMARFHPESQSYPAIPAWLIVDDDGLAMYSLGRPTYHERGLQFDWSADNQAEIESGLLHQAGSVSELAQAMAIPEAHLADSLDRWNEQCEGGGDVDHGRPGSSMVAIRKPPFTFANVWPVVSNTQGGPVHDARQRVIDVYGDPIPRLYAAGELGSVFGHLYMSGGNLAECFVGGRIAGQEAALQERLG